MNGKLLIGLTLLSLAAVLGCARAAEPTATPRPAPAAVATPVPAPIATPVPALVRPTEWTVVISDDTGGGDPFMDYGTNGPYYLQAHVMETFVEILDPEGGQNVKPQGVLAKSWEIPDDKTIVFRLREGVKFHNGEELTAEHFKYAYETILATKPPLRTGPVASLGKAVVLDKHTIRFEMPSPFATALPQSTSILAASMVRKDIGGEEFGKKPVGTGPYKIVAEWERDKPLVMESFEGYRLGKKAFPPRLIFRYVPEPSTRIAEALAGRAQIAQTVPIGELSRLEKNPKTEVVAIKGVGQLTYFINLYVKDPPLADRRVRQALNYSIDRETIAKSILEGRGERGLAGVFMPGELGFTSDMKPYPYDPAKAKQLLKEAGIPDGFTFEWTITQGLYQKSFEIAEAAANQMAKVGIKAKLLPLEKARLLANRTAGEYHVLELTFPWSWDRSSTFHFGLTLGHPDKLMVPKWGSAPEGLLKFRELMASASSTLDTEKRGAIYEQLNKYSAEEGTPFNIVYSDQLWGIQKDTSWRPHPLGSRDLYYDYWDMIGKKPPK